MCQIVNQEICFSTGMVYYIYLLLKFTVSK